MGFITDFAETIGEDAIVIGIGADTGADIIMDMGACRGTQARHLRDSVFSNKAPVALT